MPRLKPFGPPEKRSWPPDDPARVQRSPAYQTIAHAIDERLVVSATYQDETEPRILCPSRIGIGAGSHFVEVFQIGGYSSSSLPAEGEWRCFHLMDLRDIQVAPGEWRIPTRDTENTNCFERVVYPVAESQ